MTTLRILTLALLILGIIALGVFDLWALWVVGEVVVEYLGF